MKIKHYDHDLQKWVIDGVSNASDLELSNPAYLDHEGNSISADQGFTKIANKIKNIEDNLAWVYINGARGGGGDGGGGIGDAITIQVLEGDTIYTSTSTARFNILINNGTVSRAFTIVIKDTNTNRVLATLKKYSLTRIPIEISDLTENVNLEITAYDSVMNQAIPAYVSIVYGAISLSLQTTPPKTIIRGSNQDVPANFTLRNNIVGATSSFTLKVNDLVVDEQQGITVSPRSFAYNIKDILFNGILFPSVYAGQKFYFEAYATTILNGVEINSNIITFDLTVAEADSLVIVTNDISEDSSVYENITAFSQGSQLSFNYYLSYAPAKYNTFNVDYNVYLMRGTAKLDENPVSTGRIPNVSKGNTNIFSISTVDMDVSGEGEYLMVELYASAVSDPGDASAQALKKVYAVLIEAEKVDLYANNNIHTLLAYYSRVTGFPSSNETVWNYKLSSSGRFPYNDTFTTQFPDGVNLYLHKTNGYSSGFLNDTDGINNIPGIVLNGESYANIAVAEQMFPNYTIGQFGFFQPKGFNISMTYKTDDVTDVSKTVMSIGRYKDDLLDSGIEITLDNITVKIGTADTLTVKLPQNELLTVDIDVSLLGTVGWYFKIYVNGVLSAVTRVDQSAIDWTFEQDLYLGCRNNNGVLSRFSSLTIYDIKLYTSSQSEFAIVQNYISATEQAKLINGQVDPSLDAELRSKNMITESGECLIWNDANDSFYEGDQLYNILSAQMEVNTPYPIVMIRESSSSSTNFKAFSTAIFSSDQKEEIMSQTFPCEITFKNKLGEVLIKTPDGVAASDGVRVGLQGTSSLSYNAKNFELYMGHMNAEGKDLLFQPTDSWLPENEFTLKADVMDSAHVNNVVIGKIINGEVTNEAGEPVEPLTPTPPMLIPESVFASPEMAAEVRGKIKHTSDGFPCLVFVNFAPDAKTGVRETRFMGIYNFNLGRYAHFNLGLKILTDYEKVNTGGMPTLISDYSETQTYWNTDQRGVYSMEINQNQSSQGAFQQDDMNIIKFMADSIYSSQDTDRSYDALKTFYTQMANMALSQTQKYTMDDAGQTPTKPIPGEYYNYNSSYYNFSELDLHMNWNNANSYFIIALLFGMVDSMCKNLTLRSWGGDIWYTAFYDMDTAFGLNNSGQDVVEYWAHLHRWYNIQAADTGITTFTLEKNYTNLNSEGIQQFFASTWNRIWEVLENLPGRDSGGVGERTTLEKMYANLRLNLFPDPEAFIDKYYKSYTEQTGSIMFNYDYKVKYLKIAQTYNEVDGYVDSTDFSQLKFLHGNRVIHVKDWFKKRILFLDGVYGVSENTSNLNPSIDSPSNQVWSDNKAAGVGEQVLFNIDMSSSSKILYRWSYDKTNGSFWLDNKSIPAVVPTPGGETIIYMYANKYITNFSNLKGYPWTDLPIIDFPLLKELDLSDASNIPANRFLFPKVYDPITEKGLKNIEKLVLRNVKLSDSSAYTLDVRDCQFLKHLDISNSNITSVLLSSTAVLKYYNLANTSIRTLTIENQSFLEELILDGCNELTEIVINNCNSLTNLRLPANVKTVKILNCELLSGLNITYTSIAGSISALEDITIDNCPGLKLFNIQGQNNHLLKVNLIGAWNLEEVNLSYTNTTDILFPSLYIDGEDHFKSLKTVNISNTNISDFVFNDNPRDIEGNYIRKNYLDLISFNNLTSIVATNNTSITEIRCKNDQDNPINLGTQAFSNCSSLQRVKGHLNITGTDVFKNCGQFKLNEEFIYDTSLPEDFLEGDNVTNLSIGSTSLRGVFENCNTITFNDFKKIVAKFNSNIISLEATFKGCSGISGELWRDLFTNSRNVETIKEFLASTNITGTVVSRDNDFSLVDENTWGFLDYLPNLKDLEATFENSMIEWIDNNLFQPRNNSHYKVLNIDRMFRFCRNLKVCEDTRQVVKTSGRLNSKTFFINLKELIAAYPKNVFEGCTTVDMDIINEGSNTYLYHTLKNVAHNVLNDSLYTGVNLYGEIKVNVFGGISNTFSDGTTTYYIPKFTSIQYPFMNSGNNLSVDISSMGSIFRNIGDSLLQAVGIFSGMKIVGNSTKIPNDIFQGCVKLNSIESLFSNLDIDNDGEIYEFPNSTLFNDTVSLKNIKNLFYNTNKIRIKLVGEGFKNCILEDVSGAFSNSGVFGIIPYRLFFMNDGTTIRRTIKNMTGLFSNCWLLGYTSDRQISDDTLIETINYPDGSSVSLYTTWAHNIVKTPGTKVDFKLNMQDMVKTYNYDRDERLTLPNPNYIANPDNRPEDYDVNTPETIPNPDYNPGEYAFDIWYLDGYGWEDATALDPDDQAELDSQKDRLQRYFIYDDYQKQAIIDNNLTEWYIETNQNYMIPTDLFRYCHKEADLSGVLEHLSWKENIIEVDPVTGRGQVVQTDNIQGLRGRIPVRLFTSLVDNTDLLSVFRNTYFDPFYGLRGTSTNSLIRGLMYPIDLFKNNIELTNISDMFADTNIPIGVDINSDLFINNTKLRNISRVWSNCSFDKRAWDYETEPMNPSYYPQIDFINIFRANIRITNASNLFAVTDIISGNKGLQMITADLLRNALNINDVSGMFYYNTLLTGAVPLFSSNIYTALNGVSGYLTGVNKGNITNADELETRLKPLGWD